jgi:hypothetical protein
MGVALKHYAINAFILIHLAVIVSLSIPPFFPFMTAISRLTTAYAWRTGLYQNWSMFAPDPMHVNTFVQAEITYRDGQTRIWTFPQMYELGYAERYAKERYRKYSNDNLRSESYAVLWPDAARYIARLNASPSNQPAVVKLLYNWATIPPLPARGEAAQPEQFGRHLFFTYTVRPEDLL